MVMILDMMTDVLERLSDGRVPEGGWVMGLGTWLPLTEDIADPWACHGRVMFMLAVLAGHAWGRASSFSFLGGGVGQSGWIDKDRWMDGQGRAGYIRYA